MNKAFLFDRDGIVNFRIINDYVKSTEEFQFCEDFIYFFKKIKELNYFAFLITNQQGVGKNLMTLDDLFTIFNFMQKKLKELTGYQFDDIFYCTDLASTNSYRRKPNPGMLIEAIDKWNLDRKNTYMVGDSLSDILSAIKAGITPILIGNAIIEEELSYLHFNNLYSAYDYLIKENII